MDKYPKIPRNLKKSQEFLLFHFSCQKKECYPLSFPILRGHNLTKALQSSPFQNPEGGTLSVTEEEEEEDEWTNKGNPHV